MTPLLDEGVLDDPAALETLDPGGMLRAIATGGPQVREAVVLAQESDVRRIGEDGRPRAVIVAGVGGSGIAGDVLIACAGFDRPGADRARQGLRAARLGRSAGRGDRRLVLGAHRGDAGVAEEAARRGCRLVTVGAERSPLARLGEQARAPHASVGRRRAAAPGERVGAVRPAPRHRREPRDAGGERRLHRGR
jgi:glucose/mannose-6-phosphate isomerase